jgi:Flp pilus assembly protein TadD
MGDLAVRVCMGDYVVEDRVLRVRGLTRIGDCAGAQVVFPGTTLGIVRSGKNYRLRGHTLEEGERWRIGLGNIDVFLDNVPRFRTRTSMRSMVDLRFFATAIVVVAIGSWMDSVEMWIDRQPVEHAMHGGDSLKRLMLRVQETAAQRRTAAVTPRSDGTSTPARVQAIADGPRHTPDDAISRTAYFRWYRRIVPNDSLAHDAGDRLVVDPSDASARRIIALAAYNADRFDTAAWHYQILLDGDPMDRGLLMRMAMAERRRGHHRNEIGLYRRILNRSGDDPAALRGLATALARMGRLDAAAEVLDHVEVAAPRDPYTDLTAATIAAIDGRNQDAIQALDRAVATRAQLRPEMQIELRRDIALDPAFASLRKDKRLRAVLRRHLSAAAPPPMR